MSSNSFKTVFLIIIYCASSSCLTCLNKAIRTASSETGSLGTNFPLLLQNTSTLLFLPVIKYWIIGKDTVGSLSLPKLTDKTTWFHCCIQAILFSSILQTSLLALKDVSVACLTVCRTLVSLLVAFAEYMILDHRITYSAILALIGVVVGASLYGFSDPEFSVRGYLWLFANVASTASFMVYSKCVTHSIPLSSWQLSQMNNLLSLPLLVMGIIVSNYQTQSQIKNSESESDSNLTNQQDLDQDSLAVFISRATATNEIIILLVSSCLLGTVLSVSAFGLARQVSATSIMVINNANKFLMVVILQTIPQIVKIFGPGPSDSESSNNSNLIIKALNAKFFKTVVPIDTMAWIGCIIAIGCSGIYSHTRGGGKKPPKDESDKKTK